MDKRSRYFQTIAHRFFEQRGAPFFLSSKEVDLIAKWEKMEIPLRVVLEGVKSSFENYRMRPGRKGKILSLAFCNPYVFKAYDLYRERKVGDIRKPEKMDNKKKRMEFAVKRFLEFSSDKIGYLNGIYSRVQKMASQGIIDEEELEHLEGEIEELLLKNASNEEREEIKKEVEVRYRFKDDEEFSRIFRIKLVKYVREKYKIPHISLYYY